MAAAITLLKTQISSRFFENFKWIILIKIFGIIVSSSVLIYYLFTAYAKLNISPDIGINLKSKPSREVPMPAFTICSSFFPEQLQWHMNPKTIIDNYYFHDQSFNLLPWYSNYLAVAAQTCGPIPYASYALELFKNRSETSILKLLKLSRKPNTLGECKYRHKVVQCNFLINNVFTDYGNCLTVNSQGYFSLFNHDVLSKDFDFFMRYEILKFPYPLTDYITDFVDDEVENVQWTLENGYNTEENVYVQPIRGLRENRLSMEVGVYFPRVLNVSSVKYCPSIGMGYRLIMHLPNEVPSPLHDQLYLEMSHDMTFKWSANSYTTRSDLRYFSPEQRQCYYDGEKKLKFFKSYTKTLCEYECMINFTLKQCGCVKFSMMRDSMTPICDVDKIECYFFAMKKWSNHESCNCYAPCINIEYTFEVEQDDSSYRKTDTEAYSLFSFELKSHEMKEYEKFVVYTKQNFIADCSGLICMFLGISVITIIDILYKLIEKIIDKRSKGKIDSVQWADMHKCCKCLCKSNNQ